MHKLHMYACKKLSCDQVTIGNNCQISVVALQFKWVASRGD